MKRNNRVILFITICALLLLMLLWVDDLYLKTSGSMTYKYEIIKILIHTSIAYKLSKYLIKKFKLNQKYKSISPQSIFIAIFLLFNAYLICQYVSRTVSNSIIHNKARAVIAQKTKKLEYAGQGFECDSLTYTQFKEIIKYTNLPDIPKEAKFIYVFDWSEFNYRRIIKFSLLKNYPIDVFYRNHPEFKKNVTVNEVEYDKNTSKPIHHENSSFNRYKWEVGGS